MLLLEFPAEMIYNHSRITPHYDVPLPCMIGIKHAGKNNQKEVLKQSHYLPFHHGHQILLQLQLLPPPAHFCLHLSFTRVAPFSQPSYAMNQMEGEL